MNEKIRALIALAKQQKYLTVGDISRQLPEAVKKADQLENVINILEKLDIPNPIIIFVPHAPLLFSEKYFFSLF